MNYSKYFWTIRYLKSVQIWGRIWRNIYVPKLVHKSAPAIRQPLNSIWVKPPPKLQSLVGPLRFRFNNEEHELKRPGDWNNPSWAKLWKYNLHYFDFINSELGIEQSEWQLYLMHRWTKENLAGVGVGWEPYPLSLRIVNWIKYILGNNVGWDDSLANSLAMQTRHLVRRLEYHILGNHLFANAKALIFAGLFFEGPEASGWAKKGFTILKRQIPEQILPDGGHFERSPMYHAIILEDLLDLYNVFKTYDEIFPNEWIDVLCRMKNWLKIMCHPDGQISLFNDAAFGIASPPQILDEYAKRLVLDDIDPSSINSSPAVEHLSDSGYVRVHKGSALMLVDVAPLGPDYLPAHGHADTFSFELSLDGQRVIVDSGTSLYGTGDERQRQRSTSAHNTLQVDDMDSSEVWGGFRVARRAQVTNVSIENNNYVSLKASHNGFMRLKGNPIHHRQWVMNERELLVFDNVPGQGEHLIKIHYHVHPGCKLRKITDNSLGIYNWEGKLLLSVELDPLLNVAIADSTYHPEFGMTIRNKKIIGSVRSQLPIKITSRFLFNAL